MKNFFKRSGSWFEVLFFGVVFTFLSILTCGGDGGTWTKIVMFFGFGTTALLVLFCWYERGVFSIFNPNSYKKPSWVQGDGTLEWYLNSPDWKLNVNGTMMNFEEYLDIYDKDWCWSNDIRESEKKNEKEIRTLSWQYDMLSGTDRFRENLVITMAKTYNLYMNVPSVTFSLYQGKYGTYRLLNNDSSGRMRFYLDGKVWLKDKSYLREDLRDDPRFQTPDDFCAFAPWSPHYTISMKYK